MTGSKFFTSLLAVTAFVAIVVIYMHSSPKFQPYTLMSIFGMVVFVLLNIAVYYLANYYSQKSLDTQYLTLIYKNLVMKFIIALAIPILFYFHYSKPPGAFILPFLFIYIVYTIFETWILNKMAVMRK